MRIELTDPQVVVAVYVIVALPAATPLTTPVAAFTVAIAVLLLLQLPVPTLPVLVNVVDEPRHTDDAPLTVPAFGEGLTVTLYEVEALPQMPVGVV